MATKPTISGMVKGPCDEFAQLLTGLRKAKRLSARALSRALGLNEAYVYQWEHEPNRRVSRKVLERVVKTLAVSEHERAELFRAADLRDAPDTAKSLYTGEPDPDKILLQALLELPHDSAFPRSPSDARSGDGGAFVRAAGSVLALVCATELDGFPPYGSIRWPQPFVRIGVVPQPDDATRPLDIPDHICRHEFPYPGQLKALASLPPRDRALHSIKMARIYSTMLFLELERARWAVSTLQRWSLASESESEPRVSLRFKSTDLHEAFGVEDVGWEVLWRCCERSLAHGLWTSYAGKRGIQQVRKNPWTCEWSPSDFMRLMTIVWTLTGDPRTEDPRPMIRDAIYMLRSHSWPNVQVMIRNKFPRNRLAETALEAQLATATLDDEMATRLRADPWLIAGVRPDVLLAHLETLRLVRFKASESRGDFQDAASKAPHDSSARTSESRKPARRMQSRKQAPTTTKAAKKERGKARKPGRKRH